LRGFEKEESVQKPRNVDIERNKRPSSAPSTSGLGRGQAQSVDPLAKARFEWNRAMKTEYRAKFEKWTQQRTAAKSGMISISFKFLLCHSALLFG